MCGKFANDKARLPGHRRTMGFSSVGAGTSLEGISNNPDLQERTLCAKSRHLVTSCFRVQSLPRI
jgi:hypothetical protein